MKTSFRTLAAAGLIGLSLQGCFPLIAGSVVGTTLVVADRRSAGAQAEDESIEWKAQSRIGKRFPNAHINVVSYNRKALITGETGDTSDLAEIGKIVTQVENVVSIFNEVKVGPVSSLSSRSNDAWISSKIKGRFVDAAKFKINRVKVFTEAGTVFLLGIVTQTEANDAIEIARTTGSVLKVVNLFEVISDEQAKHLDNNPGTSVSSGTAK